MIENIKCDVKKLLGKEKSGHAYDHVFRVYKTAMRLCKNEKADAEIVALASFLHDCDDYKIFGKKYADNLINAKNIMAASNVNKEKQQIVCDIIQNMGYSKSLAGIRPETIEGAIVSDADMLDAIGALGITRCLAYALDKCEGHIFDKDIYPELNLSHEEYKRPNRKSDNFINHFFEKLLKVKNLMMTDSGKKEAEKRHDVMVVFLRQYFAEQNLDNWGKFLERFLAGDF
ncbi:MAG: HD domain-containing protein [Syntrophorhabdaceae bacterium]|nr:HD domain-containing protein [Syntrophorhabdaceae bacterium]